MSWISALIDARGSIHLMTRSWQMGWRDQRRAESQMEEGRSLTTQGVGSALDYFWERSVVKLYMDESGNGHPSQPLIVGAVETNENSEEIENRVRELYRRLSARRSLGGLRSFEDFRKHGFHASTDPLEVSGPFIELMQDLPFKAYLLVTERTDARAGDTETEKLAFMYESLLGDLLIRHRNESELLCCIEQNDSLRQLIRTLPQNALKRAYIKLGRKVPLPRLNISMLTKTEAMSMAIVDYIMLAVSRWLRADNRADPASRHYRAFREVEPFISVLYSLEHGLITSRKTPLH
ncbi:hypothetical protein ACN26Y_23670 [Micromonospora sp. WMMD558]|uniref:hypothetical protein n=1 Tax=Micromonospora sp. WMMD558 TaxID=3403462 RepID=UPI003BF59194